MHLARAAAVSAALARDSLASATVARTTASARPLLNRRRAVRRLLGRNPVRSRLRAVCLGLLTGEHTYSPRAPAIERDAETLKCDLRARLRPDRRCLSIVGATRHRPVLGQPLVCRTATVVSLYRSRTRQFTTSVRAILDCIWTVHDVDNPSAPTRSSAFRHRVEGSLPRKATSPNLNSKRKPEQSGPEQQRSRFLC